VRDNAGADPTLDAFRDAVASLHDDDVHVGYLATKVESMRGGLLLRRQERVWLLLTRLDGGHHPIQEDYAPWTYVSELREGRINWASTDGHAEYKVRWLTGDQRLQAWGRYGIVEDVGAYMGGSR
jgi:hypothetical protein